MQSSNQRCSICLKRKTLTDEHIFPRGLSVPGTRQIRELIPKIDPDKRYRRPTRLSQNGLKLKTTCAKRNNDLLGMRYDPALKRLYDEVSLFVRNAHMVPGRFFRIDNIELNKAARAIVGHMLAADTTPNARAPKTRAMRRFFFDPTYLMRDEYSILMWLYPSREQAIIRDILVADNFGSGSAETLWISAYKTFPLAFAVAQRETEAGWPYKGMLDISKFLTNSIDDTFNITFPWRDIPHQMWPEAPRSNGAILMGEGQRLLTKPHKPNTTYQH